MIPKPKRIKNLKLLKRIRDNDYNRCQFPDEDNESNKCGQRPSQTHHIKTVGSFGDDVPENIVRLCIPHHRLVDTGKVSQEFLRELALKRIREEGE